MHTVLLICFDPIEVKFPNCILHFQIRCSPGPEMLDWPWHSSVEGGCSPIFTIKMHVYLYVTPSPNI